MVNFNTSNRTINYTHTQDNSPVIILFDYFNTTIVQPLFSNTMSKNAFTIERYSKKMSKNAIAITGYNTTLLKNIEIIKFDTRYDPMRKDLLLISIIPVDKYLISDDTMLTNTLKQTSGRKHLTTLNDLLESGSLNHIIIDMFHRLNDNFSLLNSKIVTKLNSDYLSNKATAIIYSLLDTLRCDKPSSYDSTLTSIATTDDVRPNQFALTDGKLDLTDSLERTFLPPRANELLLKTKLEYNGSLNMPVNQLLIKLQLPNDLSSYQGNEFVVINNYFAYTPRPGDAFHTSIRLNQDSLRIVQNLKFNDTYTNQVINDLPLKASDFLEPFLIELTFEKNLARTVIRAPAVADAVELKIYTCPMFDSPTLFTGTAISNALVLGFSAISYSSIISVRELQKPLLVDFANPSFIGTDASIIQPISLFSHPIPFETDVVSSLTRNNYSNRLSLNYNACQLKNAVLPYYPLEVLIENPRHTTKHISDFLSKYRSITYVFNEDLRAHLLVFKDFPEELLISDDVRHLTVLYVGADLLDSLNGNVVIRVLGVDA